MKKGLVALVLSLSLIGTINASQCTIIKGNGTKVGDEIKCGTEEFYVLENDNQKITMISKYNLMIGKKISDTKIFYLKDYKDNDYLARNAAQNYCDSLEEEDVLLTAKYKIVENKEDNTEEVETIGYYCRVYTDIEYKDVKQDPKAKGLIITKEGMTEYPVYGAVGLDEGVNIEDGEKNPFDQNGDLIIEGSPAEQYLKGYKQYLENNGIKINSIEFMKKARFERVLTKLNNKKISLDNNANDIETWIHPVSDFTYSAITLPKINITKYIPKSYEWLISTSFWIGSGKIIFESEVEDESSYADDFVTSHGDYCSILRGCDEKNIGIGIRPVIIIDANQVKQNSNNIEPANPETLDEGTINYISIALASIIGLILCLKKVD